MLQLPTCDSYIDFGSIEDTWNSHSVSSPLAGASVPQAYKVLRELHFLLLQPTSLDHKMTERPLDASTASLFNNDLYHDIVVQCEEEKWYAHRAIVCPRSGFFSKACNGKFKVRGDRSQQSTNWSNISTGVQRQDHYTPRR